MRTTLVLLMAAVLAVIGAGSAHSDEGAPMPGSLTLTGTVIGADPDALPTGADLTVTLEDVSLADAPAVQLALTRFGVAGRPAPIPFTLDYPAPAVQPGAVYAARARVTLGERLLFTTTERTQVDPLNPSPIELRLEPVPAAPPAPDASLTDTYWKLVQVQGSPVLVAEQMREPHLVLDGQDGRFAGSGGVNRLMGGYTLAGDSLTFSQAASTMMAGPPEAMQQEQAIITALPLVRGFGVTGNDLTLVDAAGRPVLQAVAVALN